MTAICCCCTITNSLFYDEMNKCHYIFIENFKSLYNIIFFYKCTVKCDTIQLMKYIAVSYNDILNIKIKEFQNRGSGSGVVKLLGSRNCFDVPSHIPYHFALRTDKTCIKDILLTLQYDNNQSLRVLCSKRLQKQTP